jgi:hypothetical protein
VPSGQDFMSSNRNWNGPTDFIAAFNVVTTPDAGAVGQQAANVVRVEVPYTSYQQQDLDALRGFVERGGTLLLMDDFGYGNQVLEELGLHMRFSGDTLADPYLNDRDQWFPRITDLAPELADSGLKMLVLNHGTSLDVSGDYQILAKSSDMSFLHREGRSDAGAPRGPFAVVARAVLGQGSVVVVSDPSIMINSMLDLGDNRAFIEAMVNGAGPRPTVLFDTSRLPQVPLDRAKAIWYYARARLATPYYQVLLVGGLLVFTSTPLWWKGRIRGRK